MAVSNVLIKVLIFYINQILRCDLLAQGSELHARESVAHPAQAFPPLAASTETLRVLI